MQQSSFNIVVTGSNRQQTITFIREFLNNGGIYLSDLYNEMTMVVKYGEIDSFSILDRNGEKVASLFDIEDESEYLYSIEINNPRLKKLSFFNIELDQVKALHNNIIAHLLESCRLLVYVVPIGADLTREEEKIKMLSGAYKNSIPCLLLLSNTEDSYPSNIDNVFPSVVRLSKKMGQNFSCFIYADPYSIPENIRYHAKCGKDNLWNIISDYSDMEDNFVFGKHSQELLGTIIIIIEKIEDILSGYSFDEALTKRIQDSLYVIKRKCSDANFYLGVVGEFSAGKSTFINAIIKEDLLTTSPTQSTTCSATYVSHGIHPGIKIRLNDGTLKELVVRQPGDRKQLFDLIDEYAAEESTAAKVQRIDISYPFTGQNSNFVIIDTPGVNVSNSRHIELTKNIINKECDAFVVVIPADSLVGRSLESFLLSNVAADGRKYIFVVTKLDVCNNQEKMKKVLQDITNKLKSSLNIDNPLVLPMASKVIMDELYKQEGYYKMNISPEYKSCLHQTFVESEAAIMEMLQKNKVKIQSESVISVINIIFENLHSELARVSAGLYNDFKLLITNADEADDEKSSAVLKRKQTVNRDIAQLLKCKSALDKL